MSLSDDDNAISCSPLRLRRGTPRYVPGAFYSTALSPAECIEAERLERELREAHDLSDPADALLLAHAVRAAILAARAPVDPESERAQNVMASRTRLMADLLDRLSLSRRERRKGGENEPDAFETIQALASIIKQRPATGE